MKECALERARSKEFTGTIQEYLDKFPVLPSAIDGGVSCVDWSKGWVLKLPHGHKIFTNSTESHVLVKAFKYLQSAGVLPKHLPPTDENAMELCEWGVVGNGIYANVYKSGVMYGTCFGGGFEIDRNKIHLIKV